MPALPDPGRVDMLCHVVSIRVGEEPGYKGRCHGWENEPSRPRQSAFRDAGKGRVMVSSARLANWPNRVYVAGDEEEECHGAATSDGETEEGQLEYVRCELGVVGRRVQPGHEGST
jgi:hypothetical protein